MLAASAAVQLAAGAVHHDPRHDEDHADDSDQVGEVLDPAVAGVGSGSEVDGDVERAGQHDHQEPDAGQGRKAGELATSPSDRFYHQHSLLIHAGRDCCQVYLAFACVIESVADERDA